MAKRNTRAKTRAEAALLILPVITGDILNSSFRDGSMFHVASLSEAGQRFMKHLMDLRTFVLVFDLIAALFLVGACAVVYVCDQIAVVAESKGEIPGGNRRGVEM